MNLKKIFLFSFQPRFCLTWWTSNALTSLNKESKKIFQKPSWQIPALHRGKRLTWNTAYFRENCTAEEYSNYNFSTMSVSEMVISQQTDAVRETLLTYCYRGENGNVLALMPFLSTLVQHSEPFNLQSRTCTSFTAAAGGVKCCCCLVTNR